MNKKQRLTMNVLVLLALALGTCGCGVGNDAKDYVSRGGVDAANGKIVLGDVWIDGPAGLTAGANTGLRLYLANDSGRPDALIGVSTPIAEHARLMLHGKPVNRITVGSRSARDLEWRSNKDGVELIGLKRAVKSGQWFYATFRFQRSAPVTMQITVGPLAAKRHSRSSGPAAAPVG